MGLFKKKSDEQLIAEAKEKISTDHSVIIDIPVGKHGADEVVAGAMIGETGKLIAMSKYGKTKWEKVYLQVFDEGLRINYIDFQCPYDQLINIEEIKTGWLDTEAIMHTKFGDLGFKIYKIDYSALIELIGELKESYLQKVEANEKQLEIEKQQEQKDKEMDRLLRAAELHERGLLSEEEFNEIKNKFLNDGEEGSAVDSRLNFCPQCGTEIKEDYQFCINCGYALK